MSDVDTFQNLFSVHIWFECGLAMMMISPHMSVSCLVFMEMIYSEDYTANTATDSATDDLRDFDVGQDVDDDLVMPFASNA